MFHAKGTSLIEILISFVVFSIVFLGLDAIALISLRSSLLAYYHTVAAIQLDNLSERILASHEVDIKQYMQQWNNQNSELLPNGKGALTGQTATIQFEDKSLAGFIPRQQSV